MTYDFDYYSGADLELRVRSKPIKPTLGRNPTSIDARVYADALEEYEREFEAYKEDVAYVKEEKRYRLNKLKDKIRNDYDISEDQMNVLWDYAWANGHSESLDRVVAIFDKVYNLAARFAALQKYQ